MKVLFSVGILAAGLLSGCTQPAAEDRSNNKPSVQEQPDHQDPLIGDRVSANHLAHDVARCWAGVKQAVENRDNFARQDCVTARNRSLAVFGSKDNKVYQLTDEMIDAVYALDMQRVDPEPVSPEDAKFRKEARAYSLERIDGAHIEEAIAEIVRIGIAEGADPRHYENHMRKLILGNEERIK